MNTIYTTFNDMIKISLFSKIRTNNPVIDSIISTIILTFMSYIVKVLYEYNSELTFSIFEINIIEKLKYCLYKKNTILLTGKKCSSVGYFSSVPTVSSVFGNRFKAVWQEINNNIDKNQTIYEIKDFLTLTNNPESDSYNIKNDNITDGVYIVSQKRSFEFNKELQIYAITDISKEESSSDSDKKQGSKIDNITITLYSYHTPLSEMKIYIDKLTQKYIEDIELGRNGKRFIYTLIKTKYEDSKFDCWKETIFDTTRSFENMFFEGKTDIIKKIDFFINNKEWYYKKGIPYTLGIGLHGPPGTGKTSFIKSLAIKTNRHIKAISFKLLKTRRQLIEFFFEKRYCQNNKPNSIGFPQKIIVIEDIDAQGDVVLDRSKKNNVISSSVNHINMIDVVQSIIMNENEKEKGKGRGKENDNDNDREKEKGRNKERGIDNNQLMLLKPVEDDLITLDDILNLWDGLEENSGRILVISSNHYNDLDRALTRPGRIDITIEMNNASHEIITEMYNHLYETTTIDTEMLKKVTPMFYSPAEIINIYLMYKNEPDKFMQRLILNTKIG